MADFDLSAAPARSRFTQPRLGIVVLDDDQGIEQDLHLLWSRTVPIYVSRCRTYEGHGDSQALSHIAAAVSLLPSDTVASIGYGCTSGSFTMGAPAICAAISRGRPSIPACAVSDSLQAAMVALNVQRVSLLTPYDLPLTRKVADLIERDGTVVSDIGFMNCVSNTEIAAVEPAEIVEAGLTLLSSQSSDALFVACNALRAVGAVQELEATCGKPVLTSTQILVWNLLRLGSVPSDPKTVEFGRLFRAH